MDKQITVIKEEIVSEGLLCVSKVAAFLGVSRTTIYQLMERGELPWVKLGRARRVPRRAVIELAAKNLIGGVPAALTDDFNPDGRDQQQGQQDEQK